MSKNKADPKPPTTTPTPSRVRGVTAAGPAENFSKSNRQNWRDWRLSSGMKPALKKNFFLKSGPTTNTSPTKVLGGVGGRAGRQREEGGKRHINAHQATRATVPATARDPSNGPKGEDVSVLRSRQISWSKAESQ